MANNGPGTQQSRGPVNSAEAEVLQRANIGVGSLGAPTLGAPGTVYMGSVDTGEWRAPMLKGQTLKQAAIVPIDLAAQSFYRFDPATRDRFQNLTDAYVGYNLKDGRAVASHWNDVVTLAASETQATGRLVSPWDVAERLAGDSARRRSASGGSGGGGGAYTGPVTTKSRDKVVNLTDPSQAQILVDDALTQYLGRDATEEERVEFYKALNRLEKKNPQIQTSTQTVTPKGNALRVSKSSSTTRGGIDARVVAEEYAASRPEAAETAMSGQLMDWFMEKVLKDPMEGLEVG